MKKLTTYLFTALLIVAFTSCDFLEKFDHFGAGNTFDESFTVTVDENENCPLPTELDGPL